MESLLSVCIALMFSFYSLGRINLWYSATDFCVVSQRINLPSFVKIQIFVVLLSTEYNVSFFQFEGEKYKMHILILNSSNFTTCEGRAISSFTTSVVN